MHDGERLAALGKQASEGRQGRLGWQVRVQIFARKRHPGLRGGQFERPEIPVPRCTTPGADQAIVKDNELIEGEAPHLSQTPVQFAVLGQHPPGRVLEIGGRLGDEIPNGGGGKLVDRNVEALRGLTELTLGVVG
ncbi:MAG: hypothetical protein ACKVZ0_16160 [Gemmatimonadales bacterium]